MRQVFRAGALGRPRGMRWGGRWEGGLEWGIHVNPWLIHVNVWQKPLQYCKVGSLQGIEGYFNKNKWGKIEKKKGSKSGWRLTEKSVIYLIIFLQTLCWLPNNYRTKFKMLK